MKPLHRSQCKKMMAGRQTISRGTFFTRSEYASKYCSILYFEMFIRGRGWWSTATLQPYLVAISELHTKDCAELIIKV